MRFDELEAKMRKYETVNDRHVPEEMYMIARLDGRGFTKLAANTALERPFDERFDKIKDEVIKSLFNDSGFDIIYAYHQSDEISLLFKKDINLFQRSHRKFNSILAGHTSTFFSACMAEIFLDKPIKLLTVFDCRVIELPNKSLVKDYFSWRQADAARNALSTYAYWKLRSTGLDGTKAARRLDQLTVRNKHDLLYNEFGINFADCPGWQINGTGMYWQAYVKEGYNPITKQTVNAVRKRLVIDKELVHGDKYRDWIEFKFLT